MTDHKYKYLVGETVAVKDSNTFDGALFKGVIVKISYTWLRKRPLYTVRYQQRNYSYFTREVTVSRELKVFPDRKLYPASVYDATP